MEKRANAMSADSDLIKLYSGRILALAADMPRTDRLSQPTATARKRSPLCGSTVTVDITVENGVITDYGQDVKACALGQASAAVLGAHVIGADLLELEAARDAFRSMLKTDGPPPEGRFADLALLAVVKDYPARHTSTLLAFEAVAEAVAQAVAKRT